MVWALHGRGDRAEAFARLAHMVDLPVRTLVLDPPLFYGPRNGKQWYDVKSTSKRAQVDARVAELAELAKAVQKRYPGSPKPALYGFSQGAVVSMHAVARHPELFRAAVALSGYLMEGPLGGPHTAGPPTLVVWGDKDTVIAPERSKAALKRLNELGLPAKGATFSGRHSVPKSALKMLREHLSAHVLSGP